MYEQEELDKLFKACDEEETPWFEFFLMTGMREQEVMHTYWSDINFTANTVRVSHKPDRGWTPKAYKEREIPIPAKKEFELASGWPVSRVAASLRRKDRTESDKHSRARSKWYTSRAPIRSFRAFRPV